MMARMWGTCGLVVALVLASGGAPRAAELPDAFAETYDELTGLVDADVTGPLEVARGTYLASSFFAVGPPGLPAARTWFRHARTRGRTGVAAMFLAIHGTSADHRDVRDQLETDRPKRAWVFQLVGTKRNVGFAMEDGQTWKPLLRVLPAVAGCRALAHMLLGSPDPLVRRMGLYFGYWFATPPYWSAVRSLARSDRDPMVSWMAQMFTKSEGSAARAR